MSEELIRIHVDLSHLDAPLAGPLFHAGEVEVPLVAHDDATRADAVRTNLAIARMRDPGRITHYADVPASALPDDRTRFLQVTFDHGDPDYRLPGLALVGRYIPPRFLRRAREEKLEAGGSPHFGKLLELGIDAVDRSTILDVLAAADAITTAWDSATTVVASHPELTAVLPSTVARIHVHHIDGAQNRDAMKNLTATIKTQPLKGRSGWATVDYCYAPNNPKVPMQYGDHIKGHPVGTNVEQYNLSYETLYGPSGDGSGVQSALPSPLRTSSNDGKLRNQTWTMMQGRTVAAAPAGTSLADTSSGGVNWSVTNVTSDNGLSISNSSITFDPGSNTFTMSVTNGYMRTLGVYVEFLDENSKAYAPSTWTSNLPSGLSQLETSTIKYLTALQPESVVLGVPISNTSLTLSFVLPLDANNNLPSGFNLYFGSLGVTDYTSPQSEIGTILTSIFSLGFPALFVLSGTPGGADFLSSIMSNNLAVTAIVTLAIELGVFTGQVGDFTQFCKTVGGAVAGFIVNKALVSIFSELLAYISGSEAAKFVPFVGWALEIIAVAGEAAQLAEATSQITSSSCLVKYSVKATIPIGAAIRPDPRHGVPGNPKSATWPALADTYIATLQYEGGTSVQVTGPMPPGGTELTVPFGPQPALAQCQIVTAILASDGWICGTWTSGWQSAVLSSGQNVLTVSGHITEQLAPLTSDTTYSYNNSIMYQGGAHVWTKDPPTQTTLGASLTALTGLTTLDVTYDVGYSWEGKPLNPPLVGSGEPAGGPAFTIQNLSLLNSRAVQPDSRLVTPNYVAPGNCYLAYQRYGRVPKGSAPPFNFYVETSTGTPNLRFFDLSGAPDTYTVSPVPASWGRFTGVTKLDQLVILQNGVAVGINSDDHKLAVLNVPKTAPTTPALGRLCSGLGTRQGLVDTPIALDVTPDGKVLVLERGNQRVQAFDHCGNPVATFDHDRIFESGLFDIPDALDGGYVPESLQALFQEKNPSFLLFHAAAGALGKLAAGTVSKRLIQAFGDEGILLSAGAQLTQVSPTPHSTNWLITDPLYGQAYAIAHSKRKDVLNVFKAFNVPPPSQQPPQPNQNTTVTVIAQGTEWIVADRGLAESFHILANEKRLVVHAYTSWFPLTAPPNSKPKWLDLATDVTGYVFVSYYTGDGSAPDDYGLDIYSPKGKFLSRSASVIGGRIVLDIWRNLYTLDYRVSPGPGGQTEPSLSQWVPSPPAGQVPFSATLETALTQNDQAGVSAALSGTNISLPSSFTVNTVSPSGHWQIIGPPSYDVILSGASQSGSGSGTGMFFYFYDLPSSEVSNG